MRVFDNIHYFVPLNKETIQSFAQSGKLAQALRGQRTDLKMTKYLNPISYNSFVPSDIGLPVISSNSVPSLIMTEGQVQVSVPGQRQPSWDAIKQSGQIYVSSDLNMRLVSKVISQMQVFVPWTNKTLCTGLDTEKTVQAPGKYNVLYKYYSIPSSGVAKFNFTIAATPSMTQEFPVVYAHNIPFTAIKNLWPVSAPDAGDYQIIHHNTHKQPLVKREMQFGQKYLGMKFGLKWAADADLPLFSGYLTETLRHPQRIFGLLASPIGRMWRATLTLDPSASQADTIRYSGSLATVIQRHDGQKAVVPDVYGFNPQNTYSPKIQTVSTILIQNDLSTFKRQGLHWGNQRSYTSVLDFTFGKDSNERYTAFNFAVARSPIQGVDNQQKSLCGMLTKFDPWMQTFEQLKSQVQSNIQGSINGQLVMGPYCNQGQKKLGSFTGKLEVTQKRQALLANELQRDQASMQDLNPTHSFPVSAAYDRASIQVQWDEQSMPKQVLNATYFLDDQVKGYMFPHVSVDSFRVQNQQGQMNIQGYRPVSYGHWQFYATKPRENVWIERCRVPEVFETFLPLWGFSVPKNAEVKQFVQTP